MIRKLKWLLGALAVMITLGGEAQSNKGTKAQRKVEKKKQEQLNKQDRAESKAKKKHLDIQTAKTRKRMRKHRKADIHVSSYSNRSGFFNRIFRGKQKQH